MKNSERELQKLARKLKNQNAREWRKKNKDKVKLINQRYWINKAKKLKNSQLTVEKGDK